MARFDADQSLAGVAMSRAEIGDDDRVTSVLTCGPRVSAKGGREAGCGDDDGPVLGWVARARCRDGVGPSWPFFYFFFGTNFSFSIFCKFTNF